MSNIKLVKKMIREAMLIETKEYSYKWSAYKDGKLIKSDVRKITDLEMIDLYHTSNLKELINKWNNSQIEKNQSGIIWKYELI